MVRSGKPGSFIAGADVNAIATFAESGDRQAGTEAVRQGQALFERIAALPVPTVAAIQGICLGGGTEVALACDYRISDDDDGTRIGLPEVQLGIFPAWGGTTRLPRLVGLRAALDLMLTGKAARVSKARRIGLVDQVFPARQFEERSRAFVRALAEEGARGSTGSPHGSPGRKRGRGRARGGGVTTARSRRRRGIVARILDGTAPGRALVLRAARKQVLKRTGGRYPAPLKRRGRRRRGLGTGRGRHEVRHHRIDLHLRLPAPAARAPARPPHPDRGVGRRELRTLGSALPDGTPSRGARRLLPERRADQSSERPVRREGAAVARVHGEHHGRARRLRSPERERDQDCGGTRRRPRVAHRDRLPRPRQRRGGA